MKKLMYLAMITLLMVGCSKEEQNSKQVSFEGKTVCVKQ
jgi:uncharacterized protein YcfL